MTRGKSLAVAVGGVTSIAGCAGDDTGGRDDREGTREEIEQLMRRG